MKRYFNNVLIVGTGPVGLTLYVNLKKGFANRVALKTRDSINTKIFIEDLKNNDNFLEITASNKNISLIEGKCKLETLYVDSFSIDNEWDTLILATPCDNYIEVVKELNLKNLEKIKKIILISPEFCSSLILKTYIPNDIEVISLSNYFAASNFLNNRCKVITNALKKSIYIGSSIKSSVFLEKIREFLLEFNIYSIKCRNGIEAESKNITLFVHSPFLLNDISLRQVFNIDTTKRFVYKLYPEGPITMDTIHNMVVLHEEISDLYKKMAIPQLNLLKFLNDTYPVLDTSIKQPYIKNFLNLTRTKKEYLLYVRYASILIDPFSIPDKDGKFFDFSRVEYSKIYLNDKNKWVIPRRPLEDYNKLNLIWHLSNFFETKNSLIAKLINCYKKYYLNFENVIEKKNIDSNSYLTERFDEASLIYSFFRKIN